jgi:glycosyltransferase involved in cell wall biosynthesis
MYYNQKVSVILPTYNEKDSIKKVINDFAVLKNEAGEELVDEILVINNNAKDGTSEQVMQTNAIEIFENKQGYGSAIQRGFVEASGELICVCEPDDTFVASDIYKLLAFSKDVDIVYGSRTIKEFIYDGANMGVILRIGNWAVAKIIEVLFATNSLSDVGCTFRVIKRKTLQKMFPEFQVTSNFFGPEMMIIGYQMKIPSVQIPVNYKERIGESSVTGDIKKAIILGFQMIFLIFAMRFGLKKYLLKIMK